MIFRLLDNSHEMSYLIFFENKGKMSQNLSSAAVVIGALRVKIDIITILIRFRSIKAMETENAIVPATDLL